MLQLQPITLREAARFIEQYHRHHTPSRGWKWGIGANDGIKIVGVVMVGRPIARAYDDGWTVEVTRCCTDGTANVASMLYGASWRAARAMGYRRLITYTLASEQGTSLVAAGWKPLHQTSGGSWNTPSRPRMDVNPTERKTLWEQR